MGDAKRKRRSFERRVRPDLPPAPAEIRRLPLDARGFPVPWFVAWLDEAGREVPAGQGAPDFRVIGRDRVPRAVKARLCWVCGGRLQQSPVASVIGPMCVVNRISSEPPSHPACARWAARACPFLTRPRMRRNTTGLPADTGPAPGRALDRNPGVTVLWLSHQVFFDPDVRLFRLGEPVGLEWWCEGRPATPPEVMAALESGLPLLRAACDEEPEAERASAHAALDAAIEQAWRLVPSQWRRPYADVPSFSRGGGALSGPPAAPDV